MEWDGLRLRSKPVMGLLWWDLNKLSLSHGFQNRFSSPLGGLFFFTFQEQVTDKPGISPYCLKTDDPGLDDRLPVQIPAIGFKSGLQFGKKGCGQSLAKGQVKPQSSIIFHCGQTFQRTVLMPAVSKGGEIAIMDADGSIGLFNQVFPKRFLFSDPLKDLVRILFDPGR